MSGWTCITVEPYNVSEKNLPDTRDAASLQTRAEQACQAAQNGNTEEFINRVEGLQETAEELLDQAGEVDAEEKVWEYLEENWGQDCEGSYGVINWHNTPTFQHEVRGLGYDGGGKETVRKIFNECEYANRVLVVCANDTSDSGDGWLWERHPDSPQNPVLMKEKNGYEGARGRDVTGFFREEHGISGVSHPG